MQTSRFLTTQQAAEILLVNSKSIRSWLKAGKLKGFKLPGGDWRINQEDLESLLRTPDGQTC